MAALLAAGVALGTPEPGALSAQEEHEWASPGVGEAAFLGLNALLGGVTAGLFRALDGGSFEDGFAKGALGGGIVYAGKRVAAESFPAAGLLGREVAAVGNSVVRNASVGRPLLDRLMFPVGPLHLYVSPGDPSPLGLQVDVQDVYWIVYGLAESRLALDAGASLSSGAPVFRSSRRLLDPDEELIEGAAAGGVIFLGPGLGPAREDELLAHERAHVIQHDFGSRAWTIPAEDWLADHLPADAFRSRLDYDIASVAVRWSTAWIFDRDPFHGPMQAEANFLEDR